MYSESDPGRGICRHRDRRKSKAKAKAVVVDGCKLVEGLVYILDLWIHGIRTRFSYSFPCDVYNGRFTRTDTHGEALA